MSTYGSGLEQIDSLLKSADELRDSGEITIVRSTVRNDPVMDVIASGREAARIFGMRVNVELILVSIDESQAIEFAWADRLKWKPSRPYSCILSWNSGRFEGSSLSWFRGPGFTLVLPRSILDGFRSGKLVWRKIDELPRGDHRPD